MSDDFITALRSDLVKAAELHERRRFVTRLLGLLRSGGPRTLAVAATAVAGVIAVAVAVRHLPQPEVTAGRLSALARIVGTPVDAVGATADQVFVASFDGRIVRIDPRTGRVTWRVGSGIQPQRIGAGDGALWTRDAEHHHGARGTTTELVRIEPPSGRATRRITTRGGVAFAVAGDTLWVVAQPGAGRDGIDRFDADTGRRTATLPLDRVNGVAADGDSVWATAADGTLVRIDARRARVAHRWEHLVDAADATWDASHTIVPEPDGAWVLTTGNAAIRRIRDDRVVRTIPVTGDVRPLLAATADALWVTSGDSLGGRNRIWRIDADSGEIVGSVNLGEHHPSSLVGTPAGLIVVTSLGEVLRIG